MYSYLYCVSAINPEDDETVAMIKELLETRIRYATDFGFQLMILLVCCKHWNQGNKDPG